MSSGHAFARSGGLRGAAIGAGIGAVPGVLLGSAKKNRTTGKERSTKERVIGGTVGGLTGAAYGGYTGFGVGWNRNAKKWNAGFRPAAGTHGIPKPTTPDWLKGAKTKAEGRKAFHAQARKFHPDLGGDPEAFKVLSKQWEEHEPLFKTAMYNAFADELEKIASIGALLGGYAGHKLSPKNSKSQLYGVLGGALVGHMAGKGLGAAKREVVDDLHRREERELYGYVAPPPEPSNFY